jgi:hypothetical protein
MEEVEYQHRFGQQLVVVACLLDCLQHRFQALGVGSREFNSFMCYIYHIIVMATTAVRLTAGHTEGTLRLSSRPARSRKTQGS